MEQDFDITIENQQQLQQQPQQQQQSISELYSSNNIEQYVQKIMKSEDNRRNTLYHGISTPDLISKFPELVKFFDHKQDKYNRRREPEYLENIKKKYLPSKNLLQYVSKYT